MQTTPTGAPGCSSATEGSAACRAVATEGLARRVCLFALLASGTCASSADHEDVPIAMSAALNNRFVDTLLDELAAAIGARWQRIRAPFTRVIRMTLAGEALGFGISPTPERVGVLSFSQPLFESSLWALSRTATPLQLNSVADLKGLRVCFTRDAHLGPMLDNAAGQQFNAVPVSSDFASRLRMLEAGRCDVVLTTHYNRDRSLLDDRLRLAGANPALFKFGHQPISTESVHVAVRRGSRLSPWVVRLDRALAERPLVIADLLRNGP